jgi:uncharacterized protein DUF3180
MKPTRPVVLIAIVAGVGLITWVVLRAAYATLPPLPWSAVPTLLLLALGEALTGAIIMAVIHHKPDTKPIDPLAIARVVAFAKASSHAAAVLAGVFAGFLAHLGSALDKEVPRHDFFVSAGTFLAAVALAGAALFLEYACRVPKGPEDEDDQHDAPHR